LFIVINVKQTYKNKLLRPTVLQHLRVGVHTFIYLSLKLAIAVSNVLHRKKADGNKIVATFSEKGHLMSRPRQGGQFRICIIVYTVALLIAPV